MSGPILFCGDPHGRFHHIGRAAQDLKARAVILLGDLQPRRALHLELGPIAERTWFIHGNHDTDSEEGFRNVWDSEMAVRSLHGRVATLPDGTRVAGLGGVFRGKVWMPPEAPVVETMQEHRERTPTYDRWRDGPSRRHWSTIHPETIDQLAALEADVLVTHEAPSCHPHGFEVIDDLARAKPKSGISAASRKTAPKNGTAKRRKGASRVKFRDDAGNTSTGHGKRPNWFKDALANGKSPEDLLV